MTAHLRGLHVLVTRPPRQAQPLSDAIERAGGTAVRFPVLDTIAVDDMAKAAALLHNQAHYDWMVFVSSNAVRYALSVFDGRMYIAPQVRIAAIGTATRRALAEAGVNEILTPPPPYDSEALLALPQLQEMSGCRCLIVRGCGGRTLLADTLRARGAEVDHAEVYRRVRPACDAAPLLERWRRGGVDVVTVYSGEALDNLVVMLGASGRELLRSTPLIVVSPRLRARALNMGFRTVRQAEAADEAVLQAIMNHIPNDRPFGKDTN